MTDADAPSRDLEPRCFICQADEDLSAPEVDVHVCQACLLQAVAEGRSNDQRLNEGAWYLDSPHPRLVADPRPPQAVKDALDAQPATPDSSLCSGKSPR